MQPKNILGRNNMHFESPDDTHQRKAREATMSAFIAKKRAEHLADPRKAGRRFKPSSTKKKEEAPAVTVLSEPLSPYEEELFRRAELKRLLSVDELVLSDTEREKLLLVRQTIDAGILRGPDLFANEATINVCAAERAFRRNKFGFGSWLSTLSRGQQIVFWVGVITIHILLRLAL